MQGIPLILLNKLTLYIKPLPVCKLLKQFGVYRLLKKVSTILVMSSFFMVGMLSNGGSELKRNKQNYKHYITATAALHSVRVSLVLHCHHYKMSSYRTAPRWLTVA